MEFALPVLPVGPFKQRPPAYPTLKESWGVLGWYLLVAIAVAIPWVVVMKISPDLPQTDAMLVLVATTNPLLLLLLRWRAGSRWLHLRLRGQEQGWLYAALPLLILSLALVLSLLSFLHLPGPTSKIFQEAGKSPVLSFLVIVLAGPACEELLFRGIILRGLLLSQRPWVAIGHSALLFGIVHVLYFFNSN